MKRPGSIGLMVVAAVLGGCGTSAMPASGNDASVHRDASVLVDARPMVAETSVRRDAAEGFDAGDDSGAASEEDAALSDDDAGRRVCGGRAGPCPEGAYCNFPRSAICGYADGTGFCEPIPNDCEDVRARVCGCDGVSYVNECYASMAGQGVYADGPCESESTGNCDARRVTCEAATPVCAEGEVPLVVGSCWGGCIAVSECTCATDEECPYVPGLSELCHTGRGLCGPALP